MQIETFFKLVHLNLSSPHSDDYYTINKNGNKELNESFHSSSSTDKINAAITTVTNTAGISGAEHQNPDEEKSTFKSLTLSSFDNKYVPIKVFNTAVKKTEQQLHREREPSQTNILLKSTNFRGPQPVSQNESRTTHYTDSTDQHRRPAPNISNTSTRYEDFTELKRFSRYHTNLSRRNPAKLVNNVSPKAQKYALPPNSKTNESEPRLG